MSARLRRFSVIMLVLAIGACVTINVYFPEAAAEQAADRFIRDVIGAESETPPVEQGTGQRAPSMAEGFASGLLNLIVAPAWAQEADIDISSPQIEAIKARMSARHKQYLEAWYDAGAIGFGNDGLVVIRDRAAVPLSDRRKLEQIVAEENADRRAVYREIAVANGHPEWEDQIRETFARRWIANARPGWYYQDADGAWKQK
ncbi:MAG: YdbL family protein [Wenzhouxiangellaceae bacterium]